MAIFIDISKIIMTNIFWRLRQWIDVIFVFLKLIFKIPAWVYPSVFVYPHPFMIASNTLPADLLQDRVYRKKRTHEYNINAPSRMQSYEIGL